MQGSIAEHLKPYFGQRLLTNVDAAAIAGYVGHCRKEQAADKSAKLERGTLRGILERARLWACIADDDLLPHVRFHDGRHTAITTLAEKGLPD